VSREENGATFMNGFALARAQMMDELARVRQAIALDVAELHEELERTRAEVKAAMAEIERLTALACARGLDPSKTKLH
jgi:outer membrane murein-binding lipoprotein Lpp